MVRDVILYFILGGSSTASHIPVVQYLPYGSTANFRALTDLLYKREEQPEW